MKRKALRFYNRIISVFLSILGVGGTFSLASCDDSSTKAEYGTPHATFKVHGKITSENNTEINNIRVVMQTDTAYTDENGLYEVEASSFPTDQDFLLEFRDVDGQENGAYLAKDSLVSFVDPQFKNGDGWYEGEISKEVNISLKEDKE